MRTIEWLKTGLIVLLLASAIILGYSSDVFADISGAVSRAGTVAAYPGFVDLSPAEAARPGVLVLTNLSAERAVYKYDMDSLDLIYDRTSRDMGEALSALSAPEECSEADWRRALQSPGIMYEYHTDIPLEIVRDWLGASGEGYGITLRRMCLTDSFALYFEGGGRFYMSETASLGSELIIPATYDSGLKYRFELQSGADAPYIILMASGSTHATAISRNPLAEDSALSSAVSALGIDLRQTNSYLETDGTRVYVSSAFALFASPDGVVSCRRTGEIPLADTDLCSCVEIARRTVAATIGASSGESRVYYTGHSASDSAVTVTFDYFFDGGRVFIPGQSHAAKVTVSGGIVTELTLCFRSYEPGDGMLLLPEIQALAICDGEFMLGYIDSASAPPFWYSPRSSGGVS